MTGANGTAAIEVRGLSKTFAAGRGRRRRVVAAVRDISFRVDPGERVAYIGPNGRCQIVPKSPGLGVPLLTGHFD